MATHRRTAPAHRRAVLFFVRLELGGPSLSGASTAITTSTANTDFTHERRQARPSSHTPRVLSQSAPMDILFVLVCAGLAGFVDAIVGGGGLILVPAMFSAYPNAPSATLLGNNKSVSLWGTLLAAWNFSRRLPLNWAQLSPAIASSWLSSLAGAWCLGMLPSSWLRLALPFVLLALLVYTWRSKRLGQAHAPVFEGQRETLALAGVAMVIGFYDGFFGPGTGSFLIFILVRYLGYDFLHASSTAKVLNSASNAAALSLFIAQGQIWWHLAIPMAVCNVMGSFMGTTLAMRLGSQFVRWMFLLVVSALIVKTAWDAYADSFKALLMPWLHG